LPQGAHPRIMHPCGAAGVAFGGPSGPVQCRMMWCPFGCQSQAILPRRCPGRNGRLRLPPGTQSRRRQPLPR
jgi:hypothetical protein